MLLVEQLERQALADRQALLVRGVTDDLPSVFSEHERFDAWLNAEPEQRQAMSPADLIKLEELTALGVA